MQPRIKPSKQIFQEIVNPQGFFFGGNLHMDAKVKNGFPFKVGFLICVSGKVLCFTKTF